MKRVACLILCLFGGFGGVGVAVYPAMAQSTAPEPLITLSAKNERLGDVLETLARDTGYRFNLSREWRDHPVSATIGNLPLEHGLNRLLRSLNHTIIWESDKIITIMVFGKADPSRPNAANSFALPSQAYQEGAEAEVEEESVPADDPDPADADDETADTDAAEYDEAKREAANAESNLNAGGQGDPSGELEQENPSPVHDPPGGAAAE